MSSHTTRCGWAQRDITPSPGIHMGGYWGRRSGATAVHDHLMAKAMVFESGPEKAAVVALDVVAISAATVAEIRRRVAEGTDIAADRTMVCCSHTHTGPLTMEFRGMGEIDRDYLELVVGEAAESVKNAAHSLQPVRVAYSRPAVAIGVNRRHGTEGETVPHAHVLRIDGDEESAVFYGYACHPVVLGKRCEISADFPGAASAHVQRETGRFAIFVNGACGDINPRIVNGEFEDVVGLGVELGEAVMQSLDVAEELQAGGVSHCRRTIELPLIDPPARAILALERLVLRLKAVMRLAARRDYWSRLIPDAQLQWAEQMLQLARAGIRGASQSFEIHGLRVGQAVLLGLEGEMFARYQLDFENLSPTQPLIVCGFANGCIGYVPTEDEYPHGGYEVGTPYNLRPNAGVAAYRVYPSVQMIAPESEAILRSAAEEVVMSLAG